MNTRQILVASPGTGKTTTLLNKVDALLRKGVKPSRICFTTYTRAGADEARDRALLRFSLPQKEFLYFKTLHALAYRELGAPKIVEGTSDFFKELYKQTGVPCSFSSRANPLYGSLEDAPKYLGDFFLNIHNLSRNTGHDPRAVALSMPQFKIVEWQAYELFIRRYEELKSFYKLDDFTGILEKFIRYTDITLPIDYLFVDEAQDLTPLQWKMVQKLETGVIQSVIAGDDKQSVYEWAGASPKDLIELVGDREILSKSYRLKEEMVAFSEKIAHKIKNKSTYGIQGSGTGGKIQFIGSLSYLDLSKGSWLLLARLNRDLEDFRRLCESSGYRFTDGTDEDQRRLFQGIRAWEALRTGQWLPLSEVATVVPYLRVGHGMVRGAKKDFSVLDPVATVNLRTLIEKHGFLRDDPWESAFTVGSELRSKVSLAIRREGLYANPRIKILTIHGSKGLEADNVCLIPRMSAPCLETLEKNPDAEHRVFYVGVTRAKNNLYILRTDDHDYQM